MEFTQLIGPKGTCVELLLYSLIFEALELLLWQPRYWSVARRPVGLRGWAMSWASMSPPKDGREATKRERESKRAGPKTPRQTKARGSSKIYDARVLK